MYTIITNAASKYSQHLIICIYLIRLILFIIIELILERTSGHIIQINDDGTRSYLIFLSNALHIRSVGNSL